MPDTMLNVMLDTPVGRLGITERDGKIVRVEWVASAGEPPQGAPTPLLGKAKQQIAAYFAGKLKEFDLPLDPGGNALERRVFDAMNAIPYGQTRTYGDIARDLGTYGQPVGQAGHDLHPGRQRSQGRRRGFSGPDAGRPRPPGSPGLLWRRSAAGAA